MWTNDPERLKKALDHCETVYTAWYGKQLVGLVNAIDVVRMRYISVDDKNCLVGISKYCFLWYNFVNELCQKDTKSEWQTVRSLQSIMR